jgi:hypothetical protein
MRPLYKYPDNYISIAFGNPGAGKTAFAVEQTLLSANYFQKSISSNLHFNPRAVHRYAKKNNLYWLAQRTNPRYYGYEKFFFQSPYLNEILSVDHKVILIDEIGMSMFARDTRENGRKVQLERLFKVRHYSNHIICTAQRYKQVDQHLRELINVCIQVIGYSPWDTINNRGNLIFRQLFYFSNDNYEIFDSRVKKILWKYWVTRGDNFIQFKDSNWPLIFKSYKSFNPIKSHELKQNKLSFLDFDSPIPCPLLYSPLKFADVIKRRQDSETISEGLHALSDIY